MPVLAIGGALRPSGRTTAAVLIASALARRHRRVLLVDADPKHASLSWRSKARGDGLPTAIAAPVGDPSALVALSHGFDLAIVDLPGAPSVADPYFAVADVAVMAIEPHHALRSARGLRQPHVLWSRVRAPAVTPDTDAAAAGFGVLGAIPDDWRAARLLEDGLGADRRHLGADVAHAVGVALTNLGNLLPGWPALEDPTDATDRTQPGVAPRTVEQDSREEEIQSFVRDMDTHVGNLARSLADMAVINSSDEVFEGARVLFQQSLDSARRLLGLHFKHGETFMVRDGKRFFEATLFADRVLARAEGLVDTVAQRPGAAAGHAEVPALQKDLRRLVDELRLLRG